MATYENVIFISINYRLGILGFLTSNSSEAPGNQGLWDQRQAFMWVKENIKPFGGDPNKITISGESAGSIAVSAHILSPKTEGLFEQAISQSGTATAAARVSLMKQELPKTQLLAQTIGCCTNCTISELDGYMACLRNVTIEKILDLQSYTTPQPVIDNNYILDNPYNMYTQGKFKHVPYLIGFNGDEGANFYDKSIPSRSSLKELIKQYASDFYPENVDAIVEVAVPLYVDGRDTDKDRAVALSDFIGDLRYIGPSNDVGRKYTQVAPTFMYRFAHRPSSSTRQQWASAGHADEIQYTQGDPFVNHGSGSYTENEKILSGQIMRYWANFIKSGSPNSEDTPLQWSRFDCKEKGYLNIEQDGKFTSQKDYNVDRMFAWAETIPKLDSFRKNNQTTWKCDSTDTSRGATLFSFNIQCVLLMVLVDLISWL
ncbi:unnamed protein product [Owenia fusiformis]|nr:unnamed protein product [Owenia fusiformis]